MTPAVNLGVNLQLLIMPKEPRIGVAPAVMWTSYQTIVVKREKSRKAKPLIIQSIYVPILTYGHELWIMTDRIRLRI